MVEDRLLGVARIQVDLVNLLSYLFDVFHAHLINGKLVASVYEE